WPTPSASQAVENSCQTFSQPKNAVTFPLLRSGKVPASRAARLTPCTARLCGAFDWIRGGRCPLELPPRCADFTSEESSSASPYSFHKQSGALRTKVSFDPFLFKEKDVHRIQPHAPTG